MERHLPYYPDVEKDTFYPLLMNKFEFQNGLLATPIEGEDDNTSFFPYQTNIARFLSAETVYDSLLLLHEMGTGKSGSAIATAHLVRRQDPTFTKTIVLANGKTQLNNFQNEILIRLPELRAKHKDVTDVRVILRREGFIFDTYRMFAKRLQSQSRNDIRDMYEHSIIIMDEIHNITASMKSSTSTLEGEGSGPGGGAGGMTMLTNVETYEILYRFVHTLQTRKLLCLTGTPIRDKPQEIAKVLNMVLPVQHKFPVGDEFRNVYLEAVKEVNVLGDATLTLYKFKEAMLPDFLDKVRGYVSYLKKSIPENITIEYMTNDAMPQTGLEHFKVYANRMTNPQNDVYIDDFVQDLESTTEERDTPPSLAYARSKQSSLMVFPNGKAVKDFIVPIYEKSIVRGEMRQSPHMKSIGWTKAMRTVFPTTLDRDARLDTVAKYSCIYAKIIAEILKNPSELVYIYSFLKSGSGVYVLASFLTQYFGFEIVRKRSEVRTKATTKRRLVILNHDFMTDTELRDMVEFLNQDDNATADYVQVVIGTKQTKEGITLKNIRQIHVVQPEWNYADISQAIARGIRVESHAALLRLFPSIRVRIFQHVAIPVVDDKADVDYSIDIDQYRRSEIKDMNIKMIERQLIVASWDCYLNKRRNTGTVDFSRDCEYTRCAYECRGIPASYVRTYDYDTYNMFYSDIARTILQDQIVQLYRSSDLMTLPTLVERLPSRTSTNLALTEDVLESVVMNSSTLRDARLDTVYLRKNRLTDDDDDLYFLVSDVDQYDVMDNQYVVQPVFSLPSSFFETTQWLYRRRFSTIVRILNVLFDEGEHTHARCRATLIDSPLYLQAMLVETILLKRFQTDTPSSAFETFVLQHYETQERLVRTGNVFVSTIMPDTSRRLDISQRPLAWVDVEIQNVQDTESEDSTEFIRKFITDNPYKYYGIVEIAQDKTVFKIRDVRNEALVFGTNKAKIPKGEVCAHSFSRKKSGLIDILLTLNYTPSNDDLRQVPSVDTLRQKFGAKDKEKFWTEMGRTLTDMDDETLKTIHVLNTKKMIDLCTLARQRFQQLDLLYEKRV